MTKSNGWRGESYRHYLAAKGIPTVNKNYYSQFGKLVTRGLKKANRDFSNQVALYGSPESRAGSFAAERKAYELGEAAKKSPLTDSELYEIVMKQRRDEAFLRQQEYQKTLPTSAKAFKDPYEFKVRQDALNSYIDSIEQQLSNSKAIEQELKMAAESTGGKVARPKATADYFRQRAIVNDLERKKKTAENYKQSLADVFNNRAPLDEVVRNPQYNAIWAEIRGTKVRR